MKRTIITALMLAAMAAPTARAETPGGANQTIEAAVALGFAGIACGLKLRQMGAFLRGRDDLVVLASKADPDAGRKYDARNREFISYMLDRPGEKAVWCNQFLTEFLKP